MHPLPLCMICNEFKSIRVLISYVKRNHSNQKQQMKLKKKMF